jgi:hypothetical protein
MKSTHSALEILNIESANLGSKYTEAWRALNDPESPVDERCHAWIWLGYRVLEGKVKIEGWRSDAGIPDPKQIEDDQSRSRWVASQIAVETYVKIIHGLPALAYQKSLAVADTLHAWPGNLTTFVRLAAISAYEAYLKGDSAIATALAKAWIKTWKDTMARMSLTDPTWAYRFAEMANDAAPLQVMAIIIEGKLDLSLHGWFLNQLNSQPEHRSYWWKCIRKLESNPRSLFKTP